MGRSRDPILIAAAALVLVAALYGSIAASTWIGRPFAGFLLLENGLVPSAGLAHWPAVSGGEIYQQELVSIDGRPLSDPAALQEHARRLPVGSEVTYRFRDGNGDGEVERIVATRIFTGLDFTLLYGSFLVCGIGLSQNVFCPPFPVGGDITSPTIVPGNRLRSDILRRGFASTKRGGDLGQRAVNYVGHRR